MEIKYSFWWLLCCLVPGSIIYALFVWGLCAIGPAADKLRWEAMAKQEQQKKRREAG